MNIEKIKEHVLFNEEIEKEIDLRKKVERWEKLKDNYPFQLFDTWEDALNPPNKCFKRFFIFVGLGYGKMNHNSVFPVFMQYEFDFLTNPSDKNSPAFFNSKRIESFKFIENTDYLAVRFETTNSNVLLSHMKIDDMIKLYAFKNYRNSEHFYEQDEKSDPIEIKDPNSIMQQQLTVPVSMQGGSISNAYYNQLSNVSNSLKAGSPITWAAANTGITSFEDRYVAKSDLEKLIKDYIDKNI